MSKPDDAVKDAEAVLKKNQELLDENKKLKEARDLEILAKKKLEEEKLISDKKFEDLAKIREADAKAANDKLAELQAATLKEKKIGSLSIELDKLGIIPERKAFILSSANYDAIQYLEATKTILGADNEAKRIQSTMPEIFGKKTNQLPDNSQGNQGKPDAMTLSWYQSLSKEEQAKQYSAFMESQGIKVRK